MKNKIGILTYHTGYNYGASLQAYALQRVLEKKGYNVEIINFETEEFVASREMFSHNPTRLKEYIKIISRIPYKKSLKKRQMLFDKYTSEQLNISELYRTEAQVIEHAVEYDCIVCGSDQIWNLGKDDTPAANLLFYLNFPKKQRRISYAASFGKFVNEAASREKEFLPWLREFDAISVREKSGKEYLETKGIKCELCLDPTVLLDKEDYDVICSPPLVEGKYILLFGWNTNDDLLRAGKMIAKEKNLQLLNIVPPPRAMFRGVKRKLDVGPREFLSMIKNAEFVVTNSFHGTAFSVTFEKEFVSVVSGKPDVRMQSLLEQLGLEERLLTVENINLKKMNNIDYSAIAEKKQALRKTSFEYLENALGGLE